MGQWLFHYRPVDPATWVYLSSLLVLGLFFKFSRFWSVRNLDLLLIVLLAPGLLMQHVGRQDRLGATERLRQANRTESPVARLERWRASTNRTGWSAFVGRESPEVDEAGLNADAGPNGLAAPSVESPETQSARRDFERALSLERFGFIWLFGVGGLLVVRLLLDPTMVRRPLLEPNLSPGGLLFLGCAMLAFIGGVVVGGRPAPRNGLVRASSGKEGPAAVVDVASRSTFGRPGHDWLHRLPTIVATASSVTGSSVTGSSVTGSSVTGSSVTGSSVTGSDGGASPGQLILAKLLCVCAHVAIVIGLLLVGFWHFENTKIGIGTAALYLFLPYTALFAGNVDHVLPAACLVWTVVCYRRPLLSGLCLGAMCGLSYYGLFLLPLWISFYWPRGLIRFLAATALSLVLACGSLWWLSRDVPEFWQLVRQMFGLLPPLRQGLEGVWGMGWDPVFRLPIITVFAMLCVGLTLWPSQKNLGTMLSCTAAVMVAVQFWQAYGGGLYMAWYLPLLLLTIFRPNLEDRVATTVLDDAWFSRRRRAQLKVHAA